MWKNDYQDCLEYIDNYWNKIIYKPSAMKLQYKINNLPYDLPYAHKLPIGNKKTVQNKDINSRSVKLPHYYFVPNDNKFTYIYYWDSYFMFKGLMGTKREWLMMEMIENFVYLFKNFRIIPNFSAPASMGRSQPPFFSSMILETYLKSVNPSTPYTYLTGFKRQLYELSMKGWLTRTMAVA
ncbi:MAG: trehalase family glycosidase, partial [Candidatus Levyibacteriota bacterium]